MTLFPATDQKPQIALFFWHWTWIKRREKNKDREGREGSDKTSGCTKGNKLWWLLAAVYIMSEVSSNEWCSNQLPYAINNLTLALRSSSRRWRRRWRRRRWRWRWRRRRKEENLCRLKAGKYMRAIVWQRNLEKVSLRRVGVESTSMATPNAITSGLISLSDSENMKVVFYIEKECVSGGTKPKQ